MSGQFGFVPSRDIDAEIERIRQEKKHQLCEALNEVKEAALKQERIKQKRIQSGQDTWTVPTLNKRLKYKNDATEYGSSAKKVKA